jgi:hypothetical protein
MGSPTYQGFHSFTAHADLVTISTGKRTNFIFDADLVSGNIPLSFNKTTATSYELRNYDGQVLKSGALSAGAPPTISDADLTYRGRGPYGWYRLYLFGADRGDGQWGTAYGDCTFYRVSDSSLFPDNPSTAVAATGVNGNEEIARGVMGLGPARFTGALSDVYPWRDSVNWTNAAATAGTVAIGNVSNGVTYMFLHLFDGDPSELASPTASGTPTPATYLLSRVTNGTLTMTLWAIGFASAGNPGTISFSSGTKVGDHRLHQFHMVGNDGGVSSTPTTASGTGTSATLNLPAQTTYPAGRQELVFAMVATATGVVFGSWSPSDLTTTGWSRNPSGVYPPSPVSRFNLATAAYTTSDARTMTLSWNTSTNYVAIAFPFCGKATSGLPSASLSLAKTWWADHEVTDRPERRNILLFADGWQERTGLLPSMLASCPPATTAYSPFNEPGLSMSMADYVTYELAPFYTAVKALDPTAKVLGFSNVSYNSNTQATFNAFIAAGGIDYCDDIDLHAYNTSNGDLSMCQSMLSTAQDWLRDAGFTGDFWHTEQGHAWLFQGQAWPRYACRWTAMLFFVMELYDIPVERNHYWYDVAHGFDAFPTNWASNNGPGPQALPIRTMVAEIGSRVLSSRLDFASASNHYAGGVWTGADGSKTVGFLGGSFGLPDVRFSTSAASLTTVDAWGNTGTVTASGGVVVIPASELPTWIRVPAGTTCALIPGDWAWGANRAIGRTVTASVASFNGSKSLMVSGTYENQYAYGTASVTSAYAPWNDASATDTDLPVTITVLYGNLQVFSRLLIDCLPPWQNMGALLDFDVEILDQTGTWQTVYEFRPPSSTSFNFTSVGRCRSETFWTQQSTWLIDLETPVTGTQLRITINDCSEGGHESSVWTNNGNAATSKRLSIREIQSYGDIKPTVLMTRSA